jgi:hypothetical protein
MSPAPTSTATAQLREVLRTVRDLDGCGTDSERVEALTLLEQIIGAAGGAQVRITADFAESQEQAQRDAGVPEDKIGKGIAAQVALAKRESPAKAGRFVGFSRVLRAEMPATCAVLAAGHTTLKRAETVVKETLWLELADRQHVDTDVASRLPGWGDAEVEREVRKRAYRLDPRATSTGRPKQRRTAP